MPEGIDPGSEQYPKQVEDYAKLFADNHEKLVSELEAAQAEEQKLEEAGKPTGVADVAGAEGRLAVQSNRARSFADEHQGELAQQAKAEAEADHVDIDYPKAS